MREEWSQGSLYFEAFGAYSYTLTDCIQYPLCDLIQNKKNVVHSGSEKLECSSARREAIPLHRFSCLVKQMKHLRL